MPGSLAPLRPHLDRLRAEARAYSGRVNRHRTTLSAGGLAYFAALSVAPAAVVIGWLAGIFLDPKDVADVMQRVVQHSPGSASALAPFVDSVMSLVEQASGTTFRIATVVSLVLAVYAASRMVYGLRLALNTAFDVPERYAGLGERLLSTLITLIGMVIAVAAMVALTVLPRILSAIEVNVRVLTGVAVIDWGIVGLLVWVAVRWLIKRGANHGTRVPVWAPGPMVAAVWILASTVGLGLYVRMSSALSAAIAIFGSAIVVLLWLYLCFLGLLYGAEIEAERQVRRATSNDPSRPTSEPTAR